MVSIFVVEDDPTLQALYKYWIKKTKHKLKGIASNGEEALKMLASYLHKPDIILMDYRMPIKNGIETTKEIKKNNEIIDILFCSADESIKNEALANGARDFIKKPFDFNQLLDKIENYTEKSEVHLKNLSKLKT